MKKHEEKVPFDTLFDAAGHFGLYQLALFIVFSIISFTGSETTFLNFVGYTPNYWCRVEELKNYSYETQKHVSLPIKEYNTDGKPVYKSCSLYNMNYSIYNQDDFLNWDRNIEISNDTKVIACPDGWVYDKSVIQQSITTKWDLVCGDGWMVQFVGTMSVVGFMLGSLVLGPLSDRYGRRPVLVLFLIVKIGASFLSAFAPNYPTIVVARVLVSVGSLGSYVLSFSLMMELIGPAYRTAVGVTYATVYSFGFMAIAVFGYFIREDVGVQIVMAAMPCAIIPALWIIPESPRWLLLNNRPKAAESVIRTIAATNKRELADDFDITRVTVNKATESNASIMDILKSQVLRKRGGILCLHWFTDSLIFYALSLNTAALSGDVYLNTFLLGAVEIPANILAILLMNWNKTGRRWTACISLLMAGFASIICVPIIITDASPMTVTVLSLVGKAGATMGFSCMYVYTSEVFPTEVRNIGLGMCSFCSRISGMAAPFVGGPLAEVWLPLPSVIFGSFGVATGVLSLLLPETLGTPLSDTVVQVEEEARSSLKKHSLHLPDLNKGSAMNPAAYDNLGYQTQL